MELVNLTGNETAHVVDSNTDERTGNGASESDWE